MTDDPMPTEQVVNDEVAGDAPPVGLDPGGGIDGAAAWPWLKDAALLVFLVFFGLNYFILRSIGLDDATGAGGAGGAASGPVDISLLEFEIRGDLTVQRGIVTFHIVNDGAVDHNLVLPDLGLRTPILKPGDDLTLDLGRVAPRTYDLFCNLPGHRESGMETKLVVSST